LRFGSRLTQSFKPRLTGSVSLNRRVFQRYPPGADVPIGKVVRDQTTDASKDVAVSAREVSPPKYLWTDAATCAPLPTTIATRVFGKRMFGGEIIRRGRQNFVMVPVELGGALSHGAPRPYRGPARIPETPRPDARLEI
jgi:hypothetical protein